MITNIVGQLLSLKKQLFPTGRAFRIPEGSVKEKVENSLSDSSKTFYEDAVGILDTILPDNDNFTTEDASLWENRLGMIDGTGIDLEDRKASITRKLNHPGNILARQSWDYIQYQLQLAGFDVYVHENTEGLSPVEILIPDNVGQLGDNQLGDVQLGNTLSENQDLFICVQLGNGQLGDNQLGCTYKNKVINHIEEYRDYFFNIGSNEKSTFIISGETKGEFASVSSLRKDEFRQLILRLKPVQTVAYLFINYT